MSDRKRRHEFSISSFGVRDAVPISYGLTPLLLVGAGLLVAAASTSPWLASDTARLEVTWSAEWGGYAYRLRGQYSIRSVNDDFATSIANGAASDATASNVDVPEGVYRVRLESGYTLERSLGASAAQVGGALVGQSVEVVPASVVSANPVVVFADRGHVVRLGLSLVDMPGTTAEPEPRCMNGS